MQLPLQLNCIYGFALLFNFAHAIWTPFVLFVPPSTPWRLYLRTPSPIEAKLKEKSFQTSFYTNRRAAQMKQHFLSRKCDLCAFECKRRTSHAPYYHFRITAPIFSPNRDAYPLMMKTALASEKLWELKTAANKEAGPRPPKRMCVWLCWPGTIEMF